jgi:hypothetical protein
MEMRAGLSAQSFTNLPLQSSSAALKPTIFSPPTNTRLISVRRSSASTSQNGPFLLTHIKNSFLGETTHYLKSLSASQILPSSPVPINALIKRCKERPLDKVIESQKKLKLVNQIKHMLLKQPNHKMSVAELAKHRKHLGLQRGRRLIPILKRYPSVFQLTEEDAYCFYFTLTPQAQELHWEEVQIKSQMEGLLVENLRKLLMMSVSKRVLLEKIAHLATDMGLPMDFRTNLCNKYPEFFKVVDTDYGPALELTSWDPSLAVSSAEKKTSEEANNPDSDLILDRPRKFKKINLPNGYSLSRKDKQRILMFQEMPFISPYSDCTSLKPASMEAEKHACAVIHELLSLTVEKRTLVDTLTHFRHAFKFSNKVRAVLLRHPQLFYVSFKGDRDSVFLREAYRGSELKEKGPLLLWKEKLQALMLAGKRQATERQDEDGESMDEDEVVEGLLSDGMFEVEDEGDFDNFDGDEWSDLEDGEIGLAPKPEFPGQAEFFKSPVERKLAAGSCDAGSREHW